MESSSRPLARKSPSPSSHFCFIFEPGLHGEPRPLTKQELADALRIVSIGIDTGSVTAASAIPVDLWEGVPRATENERAREALMARIEVLLERLASEEARR